jgi:hypothetical protein
MFGGMEDDAERWAGCVDRSVALAALNSSGHVIAPRLPFSVALTL